MLFVNSSRGSLFAVFVFSIHNVNSADAICAGVSVLGHGEDCCPRRVLFSVRVVVVTGWLVCRPL